MVSRLQKILEYSHLSPTEFAEKIEIQRSTISHILNGRNKPSLDFLMKVKDKFPEISWDWLILGKGKMTDDESLAENARAPEPAITKVKTSASRIYSGEENSSARNLTADTNQIPVITEKFHEHTAIQNLPVQTEIKKTVSRVMLFFTDGTFETFTP